MYYARMLCTYIDNVQGGELILVGHQSWSLGTQSNGDMYVCRIITMFMCLLVPPCMWANVHTHSLPMQTNYIRMCLPFTDTTYQALCLVYN